MHQFSTDPLSYGPKQCALEHGHESRRHIDDAGRWWESWAANPLPQLGAPVSACGIVDQSGKLVAVFLLGLRGRYSLTNGDRWVTLTEVRP